MKIYFAGSIRGGRDTREYCEAIINELKKHGTVLTEHIGDPNLTSAGEERTEQFIFERDMDWVTQSDVIVAEVSAPSLGVGYELGRAEAMGKPILCLYRATEGKRLSAMVAGNAYIVNETYQDTKEVESLIEAFLMKLRA
jgi:2'-deoxynucleoside 5'-phosphate N-hydrolase